MTGEEKLNLLISDYFDDKERLDSIKKRVDNVNLEIKSLMKELDLTELNNGYCTAKIGAQHRESFNDDKVLNFLHTTNSDAIKVKEYVDYDVLESEIYNDKFTQEQLASLGKCKTVKDVITLTVRRNK